MKAFKIIVLTICFISTLAVEAQINMNIYQTNGNVIQIPLSNIDSITYTEGIASSPGTGVTFDGYTYPSIVLGNGQEWMSENLRSTVYANGDPIQNVPDSAQWTNLGTGAWVHCDNNSQNETQFGKLYNGFAILDSRNVCPNGWHVPTLTEWSTLINYIDPNANGGTTLPNGAGGVLKSVGLQYWQSPNTGATNELGFSGLPGGLRQSDANFGDCNVGFSGYWWTTSEYSTNIYWNIVLVANETSVIISQNYPSSGFSVRCIKD